MGIKQETVNNEGQDREQEGAQTWDQTAEGIAFKLAQGRPDVSTVVKVTEFGTAEQEFTIGHKSGIKIEEALKRLDGQSRLAKKGKAAGKK